MYACARECCVPVGLLHSTVRALVGNATRGVKCEQQVGAEHCDDTEQRRKKFQAAAYMPLPYADPIAVIRMHARTVRESSGQSTALCLTPSVFGPITCAGFFMMRDRFSVA